jgi:hypothetical protein
MECHRALTKTDKHLHRYTHPNSNRPNLHPTELDLQEKR